MKLGFIAEIPKNIQERQHYRGKDKYILRLVPIIMEIS